MIEQEGHFTALVFCKVSIFFKCTCSAKRKKKEGGWLCQYWSVLSLLVY